MTKKYNLSSSMADRIDFDETQKLYAIAMLQSLSQDIALEQDPDEYALIGLESFEIDLEVGSIEVDDVEEAKARFLDVFSQTVRTWQTEHED